ncbi:hypothetical protein ABPG74_018598 [Tetrahymena malaccensis]
MKGIQPYYLKGIHFKLLVVIIAVILRESQQHEYSLNLHENEIIANEWYQTIIGSIKYAKMSFQNDIIIQNFKNQIMKYDFQGNQKWSTKVSKGELIKVQKDWAIVFKQSSKSLVYVDLEIGKPLYEVSYGTFKDDHLPRMKSSQKFFIMHDQQNIFWIQSNEKENGQNNQSNAQQQFSEEQKSKDPLSTGSYSTGSNYEILNIQIDNKENIHVLLQYKKSQICLGVLEINEQDEANIRLRRCRQMSYNQKIISYGSVNGFLIQNIKDVDTKALRIVYFDSSTADFEENNFSIFSSEEDIYSARETIHQIHTYDQNEIVIFRYANYLEICRLTALDLICPDIFIKKRMYSIIPTYNYQSILFLSSSVVNQQDDLNSTSSVDENELKKELNAQLFDLEQYQVFNFNRLVLEESIQSVFPKINMKNPSSPSLNIVIQTNKQQVVFSQLFQKQHFIYSTQEGSLQNDLSPLFYRYYKTVKNPYPQTKLPEQANDYLSPLNILIGESCTKTANAIISNIKHRWERDIINFKGYIYQLKNEFQNQQHQIEDSTENDRMYGFEQMILIPTRNFLLFAYNSGSGKLIYKQNINGQSDQNEVIGLVRLAQDRKKNQGFYVEECSDQFIIIINNSDYITLQFIEPQTGELLRTENVDMPEKQKYSSFMKAKLSSDSKKEHLLFFTNKNSLVFYPSLDLVEDTEVNNRLRDSQIFVVKQEFQEINFYQLSDLSSGLQQKSSLPVKPNQKLIKITQNLSKLDLSQYHERMIAIETETKDAYRWLDFENRMFAILMLNEHEKKLTISIVDTATNKILIQRYMANVKVNYPIDMFLHENKLFVSFYSDYYEKQILYEMKLYFRHFLTIFSLPNPELPIESIACDAKTLFSEQTIGKMHQVVLDNLVFTNYNNDIIYINIQKLNETDTTLYNSDFTQINTVPLSSIQHIYIQKTSLTSRYLLIANGAQIYSVNFTPQGRFDTLPLDFNYNSVINSMAIGFTLVLISKCFNFIIQQKKKLKDF